MGRRHYPFFARRSERTAQALCAAIRFGIDGEGSWLFVGGCPRSPHLNDHKVLLGEKKSGTIAPRILVLAGSPPNTAQVPSSCHPSGANMEGSPSISITRVKERRSASSKRMADGQSTFARELMTDIFCQRPDHV